MGVEYCGFMRVIVTFYVQQRPTAQVGSSRMSQAVAAPCCKVHQRLRMHGGHCRYHGTALLAMHWNGGALMSSPAQRLLPLAAR